MKTTGFILLNLLCFTALFGQLEKGRSVRPELERFKKHGAAVNSSDTQMVNMIRAYVTFGEIFTLDEVEDSKFEGLYFNEVMPSDMYYYTSSSGGARRAWAGSEYFLIVSTKRFPLGKTHGHLREHGAVASVPISNSLREKWPLYLTALNSILHHAHRLDEDISIAPKEYCMKSALGKKVLELKNLDLLIMNSELSEGLQKKTFKIGEVYPFPHTIVDLYEGLKAFEDRKPRSALIFTNQAAEYRAVYILRCDTHELIYGWVQNGTGGALFPRDFDLIYEFILEMEKS